MSTSFEFAHHECEDTKLSEPKAVHLYIFRSDQLDGSGLVFGFGAFRTLFFFGVFSAGVNKNETAKVRKSEWR